MISAGKKGTGGKLRKECCRNISKRDGGNENSLRCQSKEASVSTVIGLCTSEKDKWNDEVGVVGENLRQEFSKAMEDCMS